MTSTHSAIEDGGGLWGIQIQSLFWVAPFAALSLGVFVVLAPKIGPLQAALRTVVPMAFAICCLRLFQQCGPKGHLRDHVESIINGGDASPRRSVGPLQSTLFSPFPDGYILDGLLVFGGISGHVSRGFWLETPDLRTASIGERNRSQSTWSDILRVIPEGWSAQFLEVDDDSALRPQLSEYQCQTQDCRNPTFRNLRQANYQQLGGELDAGRLRLRRVALFVGYPLKQGRRDESHILGEANNGFRQWEHTLQQLLARIGGRAISMNDSDILRLWVERFNPSLRCETTKDVTEYLEPTESILDNVWRSELRSAANQGFVLDGYHHLAVSLKRLPAETFPTIIHSLAYLPFKGVSVTVQIQKLEKEPLLKQAQTKVERLHHQLQAKPNEKLAVSLRQLTSKIRRLTADGVVPLEVELIVVVRAQTESEVLDKSAAVKAAIQRMSGAQAFEAALAATSRNLFAKSLPGWMGSSHVGYRHYCEDPTVSDLLPIAASFRGHPSKVDCLFPGGDGGLVNVASFLGEGASMTPQNFVVLGAPGVGKSVTVCKILMVSGHSIGFTAIVEQGLSQAPFTRALNSEPFLLRSEGNQTFNVLSTNGLPWSPFCSATTAGIVVRMMGIPTDEDRARRQHALVSREIQRLVGEHAEETLRKWPNHRRNALRRESAVIARRTESGAGSLVDAFLSFRQSQANNPVEAAAELAALSEAELMEHEHGHSCELHELVYAYLAPEEHLTLSSLRESLELSSEDECRTLSILLVPWCEGGAHGKLFDGATNIPLGGPVLHYELGFIPEGARELKSIVGFAALNSIRDHCLRLPREMRKRIVIDELSRFIEVPGGEAILRELFESFRKTNTQIIIIGQQYSRIADSPIRAAIMGCARAWLIFNTGDSQDITRLGTDLGLSSVAQEAIRRFPRPDQMPEPKYSEFLYFHTDARQPICGTARYVLLPQEGVGSQP